MTPEQIETARQVFGSRPPDESQAQAAAQECQDRAFCAGTFKKKDKRNE